VKFGAFQFAMPVATKQNLKPGNLKDPAVAQLFSTKDPETRYYDLREVGSGSFGNVYYVCFRVFSFTWLVYRHKTRSPTKQLRSKKCIFLEKTPSKNGTTL
jgi:hypothetical protein